MSQSGVTKISIISNSFAITQLPRKTYWQYDVINPEIKPPRKRQQLLHHLQTVVEPDIFHPRALYDGKAILYSSHELRLPEGRVEDELTSRIFAYFQFCVTLAKNQTVPLGTKGAVEIILSLTAGGVITPRALEGFVSGKQQLSPAAAATAINLLQIIVKQSPNQDLVQNARAFFVPEGKKQIDNGLEIWKGFYHDSKFRALQKHLHNLRIKVKTIKGTKVVRELREAVGQYSFTLDESGRETTVQQSVLMNALEESLEQGMKEGFYRRCNTCRFDSMSSRSLSRSWHDSDREPIRIDAKFLSAPRVITRGNSAINPRNGSWDMRRQQVLLSKGLRYWAAVNFDTSTNIDRFEPKFKELIDACRDLGIQVGSGAPTAWVTGHPSLNDVIRHTRETLKLTKPLDPKEFIIFVILPDSAEMIKHQVKFWGDCVQGDIQNFLLEMSSNNSVGIMTQCFKSSKLGGANNQFMNLVVLKLNARLGGTNASIDTFAMKELSKSPYMLIGADMPSMKSQRILRPPMVKNEWGAAKVFPKLLYLVVGKSYQVDKTGNCPPGTLVDNDITQPAIRDFFLQSHSGIKGTSRSGHYVILKDEIFGTANVAYLQQICYALCHIYANCTRSISIPTPVYYADVTNYMACTSAASHFDPNNHALQYGFSDTASTSSGSSEAPFNLQAWEEAFKPVHSRLSKEMHFL
ncbi:hypothetical protein BDQ17DRAFT_1330924 [Cyathus striatus]|nr:hypothetical protein BDQ17DRAFT_1330924 [Cyathus striatus]